MTTKGQKIAFFKLKFSGFFLSKLKNTVFKQIVVYVVAFDPIKIQTCLAPQNECQHLSFVKDTYVVGEQMTKNGRKKPN